MTEKPKRPRPDLNSRKDGLPVSDTLKPPRKPKEDPPPKDAARDAD